MFHSSQILSQQMTATHRNEIKHRIKEILNPATNNWLHFSSYWLLSRSCLGKAAESWFMTAHRNKGSSHPCSGNISILPLKFLNSPATSVILFLRSGPERHKVFPVSSGARLMAASCRCHSGGHGELWPWPLCARSTAAQQRHSQHIRALKNSFIFPFSFQQQPQRATHNWNPTPFDLFYTVNAISMLGLQKPSHPLQFGIISA